MRHFLLAAALAAAGLTAGVVRAESDHDEAYQLRQSHEILALDDILEHAGVPRDARILEVETEHDHGRRVYEIEYVTPDGRITEIVVDARTGEVLGKEAD